MTNYIINFNTNEFIKDKNNDKKYIKSNNNIIK